jgi:hypothetical protein
MMTYQDVPSRAWLPREPHHEVESDQYAVNLLARGNPVVLLMFLLIIIIIIIDDHLR